MTSTTEGSVSRHWPRPLAWVASGAAALAVGAAAALLAAPQPPVPQPPASELALASAADDAARLAVVAEAVAVSGPEAGRAAADGAATVLGLQASVLAERPRYPEDDAADAPRAAGPTAGAASGTASGAATGAATAAAGASPSSSGPGGAPVPGPGDLARQLAESAGRRLADVSRVDGPTASALASLAAGQLLAARALDPLAVPGTGGGEPADAQPADAPAPASCPSPGLDPAAFEAVQTAEAAGLWTYTVLAARTGGEQRAQRLDAASAHEAQLALLERTAREVCVVLPPRAPGAALPAEGDSAASLAALEESAAQAWAELVGVAEPGHRAAAAQGLAAAAARRSAVAPLGPAAAAFPGHRSAQESAASLAGGNAASPAPD